MSPVGQTLPSSASMRWSGHLLEADIAALWTEVSHGPEADYPIASRI